MKMVRRKSVRFSSEERFRDLDLGLVSVGTDSLSAPTKPILVRRAPNSTSGTKSQSKPSKQESQQATSCLGTKQTFPIRHARSASDIDSKTKNSVVNSPHQQLYNKLYGQPSVTKAKITERVSTAPPGEHRVSRSKLRWDSQSKQWFSNKSLRHPEEPKPIDVRVFKFNVDEPKIDRWTGNPDTRITSINSDTSVSSDVHSLKSIGTVELINSLRKSNHTSGLSSTFSDFRNQSQSFVDQNVEEDHRSSFTAVRETPSGLDEISDTDRSAYHQIQAVTPHTDRTTSLTEAEPHPHATLAHIDSHRISQDASVGIRMSLGTVYPPDSFSKSQAKAELQGISTRLGSYIQYVREISENANQVDLAAFVNSIKILEEELVNMKGLYERELDSARQDGEELSRNKNQLQQETHKLRAHVAELENRLTAEVDKNKDAISEINSLQHSVMQRDRDLTEAKLAIQRPINDLDLLTKEFNSVLREKEDVKRRYEREQLERQEEADKNHQLQKKLDINLQVHEQEAQDLNDRLNAASNTVLGLEAKIREMTHADTALADMLQRVRDVAETEIARYQQDSEARFSQNISELRSQLNECNRKIADLNDRNQQLHVEIGEYQSNSRSLQGQVTSLEHQRRVLEDELASDRERSHQHIKLLENKLVQLQDNIITKMKELNTARDAQVPLKAEIETLRSMLEEEEKRLKMPPTPRMDFPSSNPGTDYKTEGPGPLFTPVGDRGSPRPLGPVRVRSAPVSKQRYIASSMGQGKDYFDEMFHDLRVREMREEQGLTDIVPVPPAERSPAHTPERRTSDDGSQSGDRTKTVVAPDYTSYTASAVGDLKILEVAEDGSYIRLLNGAITKETDLGGFMVQQNVGGHPVAVFRFPPRVRVPAGGAVAVWASCNDPVRHQPPTDFFFKEQHRWGTGPECTTIVCKPNGQAVAWTTATHRLTQDLYTENSSTKLTNHNVPDSEKEAMAGDLEEYNMNVNAAPKEPVYLRREKQALQSLNAPKHPHGVSPPTPVHPHTGQARPLTYGNDNSSVNRQTRAHSTRPDPIPGAPYAGASAQRMGSASLRKYPGPPTTVRGSGSLANRSTDPPGTVTSRPPSAFQKPHNRFDTGMLQLNSQHNQDFQPPMPRPPLFSSW